MTNSSAHFNVANKYVYTLCLQFPIHYESTARNAEATAPLRQFKRLGNLTLELGPTTHDGVEQLELGSRRNDDVGQLVLGSRTHDDVGQLVLGSRPNDDVGQLVLGSRTHDDAASGEGESRNDGARQ